ncbi:Zinc finger MYM-type protein 1 [Linum perenne]
MSMILSSKKLYSLEDTCLRSSCMHIEGVLKNNEQCDIDGNDLYERSFSKLKLLKSYLRSTMTQERLNGLAMVAIENNLLEDTKIEELIDNFISKNARRLFLFK